MTERQGVVLTAVGPDRPGLVNDISRAIHGASGNLEDSRMAILGGEFALILLVTGTPAAIDAIRKARPELEKRLGLSISLRETQRPEARGFSLHRIRVSGEDRAGIVASVSNAFAVGNINVASLESRLQHAPESGTPLFVLTAELQVPTEGALATLRRDLQAICEAENLDYVLEPA